MTTATNSGRRGGDVMLLCFPAKGEKRKGVGKASNMEEEKGGLPLKQRSRGKGR